MGSEMCIRDSLKTFETKQIVVNPLFKSEHGGTFVTPNTEYIIEAAQYPAPYAKEYAPLEDGSVRLQRIHGF